MASRAQGGAVVMRGAVRGLGAVRDFGADEVV